MDSEKHNSACGFGELLVTCLYGEASELEWREFNRHCDACKDCKAEFAAFSSVRQDLTSWQVDIVPRIEIIAQKSPLEVLRELAVSLPIWFKLGSGLTGLAAAALVLLAVSSARIAYGAGGFEISFGKGQPASSPVVAKGALVTQDDVRALVADAVAAAQVQDEQKATARMASLELKLNEAHRVELQRAVMQLKDQRRLNSRLMMADNGHQTLAEWLFSPGETGDKPEGNENETRNY